MAFDPAFLDELRARTPIAGVIGRRARLSRSGRNWKACCPFHGEKTPSFYVYDDHFHCFGCGAHGDVISFVMQSGGQSFLETVAALAAEAGLEVPQQDQAARAAAARARTLVEALDAAQRSFARRLRAPEGREGLAYLRGRGLSDATIEAFGLGWSGDGRGALAEELRQQDIGTALMAEAGLMRLDEEGQPKGELFFQPGHLPDPRPARRPGQFRRPHAGGRPAEIPQRPGDRAVQQAAHLVRARPRARQRCAQCGQGATPPPS